MNEEFFNYDLKELNKILETSELCSKEIKSRKTRLESNVKLIRETEERKYYNQYYQRAHEIRSILFLKQFGHLKIAEDYRNCQGCDFILNENTYIECVCSSEGIAEKNGLAPHLIFKDGVSYYNEKRNLLNARFTSSLCDKVDFYYKRVGNSIAKDKPFIIFISTGSLTNHWFKGNYAIALTDILFGRGNIRIEINCNPTLHYYILLKNHYVYNHYGLSLIHI